MSYACLEHLEPQAFFRWFGAIAAIPHGSGKEEKLIAFLQRFAAERTLECTTDKAGNVLIRVPAYPGYETQSAILFQAHMDMIWACAEGVSFDFAGSALELYVEGDLLRARGTTLGADNAVGMATMLALADDDTIPHPPLELLFTVCEEAGMVGIRAVDPQTIHARRMINMDCGDSHVLCVCSAGKNDTGIDHVFPLQPAASQAYTVTISGGLGGHPGLSANQGRCCCANAMGQLLSGLAELRLCALEGSQAIMTKATAVITADEDPTAQLQTRFALIRQVYAQTDPGLQLTVKACPCPETGLGREDSHRVAQCLLQMPSGQLRCDGNDPRNIVSSGTVTGLSLENGAFRLRYRLRSTIAADSILQFERLAAAMAALGLTLRSLDSYEGWTEKQTSPFRDKFLRIHRALFGEDMELERCSGGIETGILTHKLPDMDAIGIAPTARGAHTPDEHLFISQVQPYWQLLLAVLAEKE